VLARQAHYHLSHNIFFRYFFPFKVGPYIVSYIMLYGLNSMITFPQMNETCFLKGNHSFQHYEILFYYRPNLHDFMVLSFNSLIEIESNEITDFQLFLNYKICDLTLLNLVFSVSSAYPHFLNKL
jgi:hypothetical protein